MARQELAPKGIAVTALHVGYMHTDMSSYVAAGDKSDPAVVAAAALDGVEAGATEVLADDRTRGVKRSLAEAPAVPQV